MGFDNALMDVMNSVSQTLDVALCAPRPSTQVLSELDAFARHDPLLASLRKQYLDAKAMRINAHKQYGGDDGMTDLAMMSEDSAWCAMQTRYLELRDDKAATQAAQEEMVEAERIEKVRKQKEDDEKTLIYFRVLDMIQKIREREKVDYAMLILALLLLAYTERQVFRMVNTHRFNSLAA